MDDNIVSPATRALRDKYANSDIAINTAELRDGDSFYVLAFSDQDGVPEIKVSCSGTYHGVSSDRHNTYLILHLDGTSQRAHYTMPQMGFYPPGSSMFVVVRTLEGVNYNFDNRSDRAQREAARRESH